jgi:hypothetical protein
MNCNCTWTNTILAIIIIVFAFWVTAWSQWVVVIAAALILIHAWMHKNCQSCGVPTGSKGAKAVVKGKKK